MTEAALAKADQEKALRIFRAFDIECEVVDEDFQLLVDNHPTIKAYLAGDITLSQAMFVEAYLSNGFNATKAAQTAKYRATTMGGFSGIGSTVIRNPKVKALIARRIAERAMEADEVLARIRDVAEADMGDMVSLHAKEGTDGEIREMVFADPVKAFKEGKFRHVKEYRVDKDGVIHFKLRDQDHALDQLARAAGAFEKDHAQQLPSHVVALLKLDNQELSSRDDVYEEMEDWEPDGVLESGKRETNEPDPEEPEAG
jgi:phage terminase small subunit